MQRVEGPATKGPAWRTSIPLFILALSWVSPAHSATLPEDRSILEDARLYVTAPLRWKQTEWLYMGSAILAVATAYQYDDRVQQHFATAVPPGEDSHDIEDAVPAVALVVGAGAFAWLTEDVAGYHETFDMLEAGAFSAASTFVLKEVARRDRPAANTGNSQWFADGDSFPSRHVSVAMAVGAVFAESGSDEHRWLRRSLGYGVGVAAMYARLKHQQHWLSDTVAGAALGIATARFVLNRSNPHSDQSGLMVMPEYDGLRLTYSRAFR